MLRSTVGSEGLLVEDTKMREQTFLFPSGHALIISSTSSKAHAIWLGRVGDVQLTVFFDDVDENHDDQRAAD